MTGVLRSMGVIRIAVAAVAALALGLVAGSASGGHVATFDVRAGRERARLARLRDERARRSDDALRRRAAGHDQDRAQRRGRGHVPRHPQPRQVAAASRGCSRSRSIRSTRRTTASTSTTPTRTATRASSSSARRTASASPARARQLLFVDQPYDNHNGGQLQFDTSGYLYVGMGDGGSGGDPENRAQNLKSRLGKLLRINPTRAGSAWQIVGFGLRNPWRFSFDRANGNLWIGDVGQGSWEEVDYRNAARVGRLANYGWSRFEGKAVVRLAQAARAQGRPDLAGARLLARGRAARSPAATSIAARRCPRAQGRYFFGDYCSGTIWSFPAGNGKTGAPRVEGKIDAALVVRPGRQRRALRDVAQRHALQAALATVVQARAQPVRRRRTCGACCPSAA